MTPPSGSSAVVPDPRAHLVGACDRCVGLCCVALPFAVSADFALDKPDGVPCPNLQTDHRCGIHDRLPESGFAGCVTYDCFGAGQQVSQVTFSGADWRTDPSVAAPMFAVFRTMRHLHELRWYLAEARVRTTAGGAGASRNLVADLARAEVGVVARTEGPAAEVVAVDVDALRQEVGGLLRLVAAEVRAASPGPGTDLSGADLLGADLRRRDLRGADLRGACLIGADLRGVDLAGASLLGADVRGAHVGAARLADALFVTPGQVRSARGDAATTLPRGIDRPGAWVPAT